MSPCVDPGVMLNYEASLSHSTGHGSPTGGARLEAVACNGFGSIVSSGGLAFGACQPLTFAGKLTAMDKASTAAVSVVCTGIVTGGSSTISLGASTYGPGNRISTRYLNNTTNGGDCMAFNVYTGASIAVNAGQAREQGIGSFPDYRPRPGSIVFIPLV